MQGPGVIFCKSHNKSTVREHAKMMSDFRGGGGSSKIGQNRTWGVGSSSKIGCPIILQFIPPFFEILIFSYQKKEKQSGC